MKRAPVTIDGDTGKVEREPARVVRVVRVVKVEPAPPAPGLGAVLDTIAREEMAAFARDAARELRRAVKRGLFGGR